MIQRPDQKALHLLFPAQPYVYDYPEANVWEWYLGTVTIQWRVVEDAPVWSAIVRDERIQSPDLQTLLESRIGDKSVSAYLPRQ
jgi:hypothetical protein